MRKGEKLEIEKLKKPDFMTDGEWKATLETLSMLNQTMPEEAWKDLGGKVTSLNRIRSDASAHREEFLSTEGREGTESGGAAALLLTTIGRKSGKECTTPLNVIRDGDSYVVMASLAGYDASPHWYLNLEKNPRVWVQAKDKKVPATARRASREERTQLWPRLLKEGQPLWAYFQMFTQREFPIVIITPEK
jgi:deazaflavin-dependent oxidoreductase (nitroreductase family)